MRAHQVCKGLVGALEGSDGYVFELKSFEAFKSLFGSCKYETMFLVAQSSWIFFRGLETPNSNTTPPSVFDRMTAFLYDDSLNVFDLKSKVPETLSDAETYFEPNL